jgi:hypothetical protein
MLSHGVPRPVGTSACAGLLAVLFVVFFAARVAAQPGWALFDQATREEAVQAIPLTEVTEQARTKLQSVVSRPSFFRRLPAQMIDCDPDLFVFLVRYPEVVVNMWQLMGVTKVQVKRTGPYTFDASDGAGTVSSVELIYGRPDLHVYYGRGLYEGPLLRRQIHGDCVIALRSAYNRQDDRVLVSSYMDIFVRFEDAGAELLARTLYPMVGRAVDNNFAESTKFVGQVSQAAELNGPGVQNLAGKLTNVEGAVRQSFAQHADVVYQRAVLRAHARSSSHPEDFTPGAVPNRVTQTTTPASSSGSSLAPSAPRPWNVNYRR